MLGVDLQETRRSVSVRMVTLVMLLSDVILHPALLILVDIRQTVEKVVSMLHVHVNLDIRETLMLAVF